MAEIDLLKMQLHCSVYPSQKTSYVGHGLNKKLDGAWCRICGEWIGTPSALSNQQLPKHYNKQKHQNRLAELHSSADMGKKTVLSTCNLVDTVFQSMLTISTYDQWYEQVTGERNRGGELPSTGCTSVETYISIYTRIAQFIEDDVKKRVSEMNPIAITMDTRGHLAAINLVGFSGGRSQRVFWGVFTVPDTKVATLAALVRDEVPCHTRCFALASDGGEHGLAQELNMGWWQWCSGHRMQLVCSKWGATEPNLKAAYAWVSDFSQFIRNREVLRVEFENAAMVFLEDKFTVTNLIDTKSRWVSRELPCKTFCNHFRGIVESLMRVSAKHDDSSVRAGTWAILSSLKGLYFLLIAFAADCLDFCTSALKAVEGDWADMATTYRQITALQLVFKNMQDRCEKNAAKCTSYDANPILIEFGPPFSKTVEADLDISRLFADVATPVQSEDDQTHLPGSSPDGSDLFGGFSPVSASPEPSQDTDKPVRDGSPNSSDSDADVVFESIGEYTDEMIRSLLRVPIRLDFSRRTNEPGNVAFRFWVDLLSDPDGQSPNLKHFYELAAQNLANIVENISAYFGHTVDDHGYEDWADVFSLDERSDLRWKRALLHLCDVFKLTHLKQKPDSFEILRESAKNVQDASGGKTPLEFVWERIYFDAMVQELSDPNLKENICTMLCFFVVVPTQSATIERSFSVSQTIRKKQKNIGDKHLKAVQMLVERFKGYGPAAGVVVQADGRIVCNDVVQAVAESLLTKDALFKKQSPIKWAPAPDGIPKSRKTLIHVSELENGARYIYDVSNRAASSTDPPRKKRKKYSKRCTKSSSELQTSVLSNVAKNVRERVDPLASDQLAKWAKATRRVSDVGAANLALFAQSTIDVDWSKISDAMLKKNKRGYLFFVIVASLGARPEINELRKRMCVLKAAEKWADLIWCLDDAERRFDGMVTRLRALVDSKVDMIRADPDMFFQHCEEEIEQHNIDDQVDYTAEQLIVGHDKLALSDTIFRTPLSRPAARYIRNTSRKDAK